MDRNEDLKKAAYNSAVRFIKYRPRSVLEVRERLKLKGFTGETAENTIKSLLEEGLLDDAVFAKLWAMERASGKNFGPADQERTQEEGNR